MHQVTAIYMDCEIGFGEGDSFDYALEECLESIDSIYSIEDYSQCEDVLIVDLNGNKRTTHTLSSLFQGV
jgi:hypothetical protein